MMPWGMLNHFAGVFDGKGHEISNFKITTAEIPKGGNPAATVGLFGYIDGSVKNLGITAFDISVSVNNSKHIYAGTLAGYSSGSISNCYVEDGEISVTGSTVGGLVGLLEQGNITNSYASVDVRASADGGEISAFAGGLVGTLKLGQLKNCYAMGNVYAEADGSYYSYAGGLIGKCDGNDYVITNCFATGNVSAILSSQTPSKYDGPISLARAGTLISGFIADNLSNCYSYSEQLVIALATTQNTLLCYSADLNSVIFYTETLSWSDDDWIFDTLSFAEGKLPRLRFLEQEGGEHEG
jgi:hypothetical protein